MLTFRLAWRSFLRHRRRSIITGAAIALGLAMMLAFLGIGQDAHRMMAEIGIRMGSGDVVIQQRGFQDDPTIDHTIADPAPAIAAARSLPGVEVVVPRVRGTGLLSSGSASAAVSIAGVDPALEPRASRIDAPAQRVAGGYLRDPNTAQFRNRPADIYVGAHLARTLKLSVGDRAVLTVSPRRSSQPASAAFLVRGIFRTGVDELDGFYVEIPLSSAQSLFRLGKRVSQVAIILHDLDRSAAVAAALRHRLAGRSDVAVLTWHQALRELSDAIELDNLSFYLIMAIVFVIVAIGIFNTMLMSVVERTRELGVMMAIGTSRRRLFAAVMAEALVLGVVASVVGLGIGLGIHEWLVHTGLDMKALFGDMQFAGIVLSGRLHSYLTASQVVEWTAVNVGIVLVSALYPALRVVRLDILEAMHHV